MNLTIIDTLVNSNDLTQIQLNIPFGNSLIKDNKSNHQIAEEIVNTIKLPSNWKINAYGVSGFCEGISITIVRDIEVRIHKTKIFIYRNGRYEVIE